MLRELGIGLVAYSPLGRGFLTGAIRSQADLSDQDFRRVAAPRFSEENLARNLELVEHVEALADAKGVTAGQIALAWVLSRGEDVVPIPGTKRVTYLEQNAAAAEIELTAGELAALDEAFPVGVAAGDRYTEAGMRAVNR